MQLTQGGVLSRLKLYVHNSASSAGIASSYTVTIRVFNTVTPGNTRGSLIGQWSESVSPNQPVGSHATFTFSNLQTRNIILPTNVLITQSLSNVVGGATRMGVVFLSIPNSVTVGTTPYTGLYRNDGSTEQVNFVPFDPYSRLLYEVSVLV